VNFIKKVFPRGILYNAPGKWMITADWLKFNEGTEAGKMHIIYAERSWTEHPPVIENHVVTERFKRYFKRLILQAYVVELPLGMVFGECTNFILTPDYVLLADLSREFGAYGGRQMKNSSVLRWQLNMPKPKFIHGNVAVISTSGYNNFHHWNYDCIPRIFLLKQAGLYESIDFFILAHSGLSFQVEALDLLGLPKEKIINPEENKIFFYQAEVLYVPSLPAILGTIAPWVVDFLQNLYNPFQQSIDGPKRIYLSRKKVISRHIANNDQFLKLLRKFGFEEIFPENYSVSNLAMMLKNAFCVISVHGSGLSNLCFVSPGTIVIDILAPYHQDGYYWMITNYRKSKYIGFFGEGSHPPDDLDLVRNKIDDDILLDLDKMHGLLLRELV